MERLTYYDGGYEYAVMNECRNCSPGNDNEACGTCEFQSVANLRLAQYEDTGLTPEEVARLRAQPANVPLTLDELRGMDREPVWCSTFDDEGQLLATWCHLVEWRGDEPFRDWHPELDKYGKTWVAYRSRPESEADA